MEAIKVSVIVPVYNAEKYIDQCILSILNQSLQEIEVILVNDGSTDASKEIILGYCEKDSRIVFIDSENRGVSAARNAGIKKARGKFIGFVDADDYLDADMYERLYIRVCQYHADLAITNAYTLTGSGSINARLSLEDEVIEMKSDKASVVNDFLKFKFEYANWNKIYSNEIIQKHTIFFNESMSMWEDILFNLIYIQYVNVAVTLKDRLYYYRVNATSIMADRTMQISRQYNLFYDNYCRFCEANGLTKQLLIFKQNRSSTCFVNIMRFIQSSFGKTSHFSSLYSKFKFEVKELNPEIYLFENSYALSNIQKYLLKKKWISIFSFTYVAKHTVTNRLRKLLTR